VGFHLE
jgi:hypothetical protein